MPKTSSKSKKSLVSFVIRTKNEEKLISKVLKNLQQQTLKNLEIIIVDSGSTDKTLEIIKKFPVQLIEIKPKEYNPSYALNLGINKAQGKYVGIISGHSLPISKTWLKDGLVEFKDKKVAAVTGYYTENPVGYFSQRAGLLLFKFEKRKREEFCPWLTNTNALIRKDLWQQYPFDEKLSGCEDYDWASEMIARGYNIIKEPRFSVFHSHPFIGRPGYHQKSVQARWKKICTLINKRKRPHQSFTKIKIK
ncbi:hypothetical protein A2Z41_00755 [Microgenomates group bacterium RBG_19FT_COMBO_39_10]|nr:MAG: hypothetical protein A2Z41_00755 [Microgenomates group bacterium RBG_19FT_COMBO_39_10]